MKRCPYCGAAIKVNAAAFCPKCKRRLRKPVKVNRIPPEKPTQTERPVGKQVLFAEPQQQKTVPLQKYQTQLKYPKKKKKSWLQILFMLPERNRPTSEQRPINNLTDENYDGYYEDRQTDDDAQIKESYDPELIKRIALIAGGAVVLVVLSIILMNLL